MSCKFLAGNPEQRYASGYSDYRKISVKSNANDNASGKYIFLKGKTSEINLFQNNCKILEVLKITINIRIEAIAIDHPGESS